MPSLKDVPTERRSPIRDPMHHKTRAREGVACSKSIRLAIGYRLIQAKIVLASALMLMTSLGGAWGADVTFWVSEHFDQSPNVNIGKGIEPFAPQVLDLSALRLRRDDGDVRLCFDNRPMHALALREVPPAEGTEDYCWHYSHWIDIGIERLDMPESSTKPISKGLLVSRDEDNKFTCEAVFTQTSFLWFLGYRGERKISVNDMSILPYGWDYGILDGRDGVLNHLNKSDIFEIRSGHGAQSYLGRANLKRTWSCLVPAYRMYWVNVLDKCLSGVEALRHDKSLSDIYFPVLETLRAKIFEKTERCRISNIED